MMAAVKLLGKNLGDLLPNIDAQLIAHAVTGLALDSRWVRAGDLFFAYPGEKSDGRDFIAQAVNAGAAAICVEASAAPSVIDISSLPIPIVAVPNLRTQVSAIADRYFDHPSAAMAVIGVTGTNGKTSVTQLLGQALRLLSRRCGVIGTLGNSIDGRVSGGGLTTPDPIGLQQQLADWRDQQVQYTAMEVSSHGLAQGRVSGVKFRGAVFTNLTRDHLDFHGSMENYGAAKAELFAHADLQFAVINIDDEFGRQLANQVSARKPAVKVLGYSINNGVSESAAISAHDIQYSLAGVFAKVVTPWGNLNVQSPLLGEFNLSNLLAVIAVLGELDFSAADIEKIIPSLKPIAGRMERIDSPGDIEVVVDYAHTPDALEQALSALRRHCHGKLWCVFGCGGDRDRGKRPVMGEIATRLADRVIVTSDNPRSENPADIISEIVAELSMVSEMSAEATQQSSVSIETDRATAIALAIRSAQAGDLILIAGKGHEDYQLIGSQRLPFSDTAVARTAMQQRGLS